MKKKDTKWMIYTKKADFNTLALKYNISPITARIITNRDIREESIREYIDCDVEKMHSPWMLKDADTAVKLLLEKIELGKKIRVIGDYDIDGVCSTYILTEALLYAGAVVDMDIPHRMLDGYGLNKNLIEKAYKAGTDMIITCDNGIAAIEEIKYAKELGITVIVTDHHEVPVDDNGNQIIVSADAVVDQKQKQCMYPYKQLCGAAVAYKLMEALYQKMGLEFDRRKYMEIAGIATIGDVVDLNGENRVFAKNALKFLKKPKNVGIYALMQVCNVNPENVASYHIGFIIGPCLNAGGRLETAKLAYNLLNEKNEQRAIEKAKELREINEQRKNMTDDAVERLAVRASSKMDKAVLILYDNTIHESIAGIVAGRIREQFYKPTIVLTDSEEEGIAKGSGRSTEYYNMFLKLSECKELFVKFGGHPMAAGLSLKTDNVDELEKRLNQNHGMTADEMTEKLWLDMQLPFSYCTKSLVKELAVLEPFGKANEKPVFAEKNVEVAGFRIMGKNRNVLKMMLKNDEHFNITGIIFGEVDEVEKELVQKYGEDEIKKAKMGRENSIRLAITYYPQINSFNGNETMQIVIKNYKLL